MVRSECKTLNSKKELAQEPIDLELELALSAEMEELVRIEQQLEIEEVEAELLQLLDEEALLKETMNLEQLERQLHASDLSEVDAAMVAVQHNKAARAGPYDQSEIFDKGERSLLNSTIPASSGLAPSALERTLAIHNCLIHAQALPHKCV